MCKVRPQAARSVEVSPRAAKQTRTPRQRRLAHRTRTRPSHRRGTVRRNNLIHPRAPNSNSLPPRRPLRHPSSRPPSPSRPRLCRQRPLCRNLDPPSRPRPRSIVRVFQSPLFPLLASRRLKTSRPPFSVSDPTSPIACD